MTKIKYKKKYPCGYEVEIDASGLFMDFNLSDEGKKDSCPLHGKNCPIKKKQEKKKNGRRT